MKTKEFERLVREHPELAKYFHFVRRPCKDGSGYWRRIPKTYYNRRARPVGQLRAQLAFAKSAFNAFGKRGFKDGIPVVAALNREALKGKRFRKPKWREVVEQLTRSLREVGVVLEEARGT